MKTDWQDYVIICGTGVAVLGWIVGVVVGAW
jgi:hypothetical protein